MKSVQSRHTLKKGHLPLDHVILPEVGYLKDGDVQSMRLKVNRGHSDPVFFKQTNKKTIIIMWREGFISISVIWVEVGHRWMKGTDLSGAINTIR